MTEYSLPWDGVDAGDALAYAPYDSDLWTEMYAAMLEMSGDYGVLSSIGDGLLAALTVGDSPCVVGTGAAMVAGQYYRNTANVSIVIPRPAVSTRYDRIVVRRIWASKQTRLMRVAGIEGAGVPSAMTQTLGTIYDIPVAIIEVPTAGAMTITDDRKPRCYPQVVARQGGDATDWNLAGTNNYYNLGQVIIQAGNAVSVANTLTVTFPKPFSAIPLVFVQNDYGMTTHLTVVLQPATAAGFTALIMIHYANPATPHASSPVDATFNWMAIGPA